MTAPTLTMEQLLLITTVATCTVCGLDHAPVRSCTETRQARYLEGPAAHA